MKLGKYRVSGDHLRASGARGVGELLLAG
jgi:hypothetical protein